MKKKPFLTQFAIKRDDLVNSSNLCLVYNDELDYNEFQGNSNSVAESLETKTRVKAEQSDQTGIEFQSQFAFLSASTKTAVKAEKPDYLADDSEVMTYMATETATKSKGESQDVNS